MRKEIITEDIRKILKDKFKDLKDEVNIEVFTKDGVNDVFNEAAISFIEALSETSGNIKSHFYKIGEEQSEKRNVLRSPTILIAPDKYSIRYTGAPVGEEGRSLVMSIIMVSTGKTIISDDSRKRLKRLKEKRHVRVFISPTCPYCPQQVLYAVCSAIEKKDLISSEAVEIYENKDLAEKYGAMAVPTTYVGETFIAAGLQPEEYFIESLITGNPVEHVMPLEREGLMDYDIVVIGGGPAGLTAALYAGRSGLKSIILEKANVGGQVAITPVVENYPGFKSIAGKALVDMMAKQAMEYAPLLQGTGVDDIKKMEGFFEAATVKGIYKAKAVIIATGSESKRLNITGEERLAGRGVSYCATCDGYIFKDGKNVVVVGGGNIALTDALYLDSLGAHVTVLHRRDKLRAEERLQQSLFQRKIPILWNSRAVEIIGDRIVEKVRVEDIKTGKTQDIKAEGVFIAIGYEPNNNIAKKLGLDMDEGGYIKVDDRQRTSMPMVYAAGDITGGVKQIVVAVAQGSVAALTAFEDIASPYWKRE